ncbi:7-carboxy-7-deazaguanine synthase QueE [Ruficoccus amylovorans]|uniref:7-carboxy-7-deazaguanine synthase n=1 Tax=Ruficoccus amylovorans TaxID=1804625 RepID=A0A842HC64_9BACT|nr:7-carboxy-7-deazaguanine synthase QueE [Ruficoccus amylovorans]MBC2593658.1 7-carboxy-7-deazaguanine synthase QueE [Ruficoccus amylovorans]
MKLARHGTGPEIFESLQGEGLSMGVPSVFVRLSLCNLHCTWCDTAYTWNWTNTQYRHVNDTPDAPRKYRREEEIIELDCESVAELILKFRARNLIFTGGEPLLQGRELARLAAHLLRLDPACRFEVETNGTLRPPPALDAHIAQYNVSPKLSNSGNSPTEREKPDAIAFFARCERAWFKFVVANAADLEEVRTLQNRYDIPQSRILLMPEGTSPDELREKSRWLAPLCLQHGYRFGDRLHVHLYGSKRGV